MSEFDDPIDPKTFPHRRCSECGGEMHAVDAGRESFSPTALYVCSTCDRQVKISPESSTGGWFAMSFIAWAMLAALIYFLSKPFDAISMVWIGVLFIVFLAPLMPSYLTEKRNPVIGSAEPSAVAGAFASTAFIVFLFAVVLSVAALVGFVFD